MKEFKIVYDVLTPYTIIRTRSEMGRSAITFLCPFCGIEVEGYKWSLAGSGKKCPGGCGAKHTLNGSIIRKDKDEVKRRKSNGFV